MWGFPLGFWDSAFLWATVATAAAGGLTVMAAFMSGVVGRLANRAKRETGKKHWDTTAAIAGGSAVLIALFGGIVGYQVNDRIQQEANRQIMEGRKETAQAAADAAKANQRAAEANERAVDAERIVAEAKREAAVANEHAINAERVVAEAKRDTAIANERAAHANQETARLREQVASPRSLTQAQHDGLVAVLRDRPVTVKISYTGDDREATAYAIAINKAVQEAGSHTRLAATVWSPEPPTRGIGITQAEGHEKEADFIVSAFFSVGIRLERLQIPYAALSPAGPWVQIIIGPRRSGLGLYSTDSAPSVLIKPQTPQTTLAPLVPH